MNTETKTFSNTPPESDRPTNEVASPEIENDAAATIDIIYADHSLRNLPKVADALIKSGGDMIQSSSLPIARLPIPQKSIFRVLTPLFPTGVRLDFGHSAPARTLRFRLGELGLSVVDPRSSEKEEAA